MTRRCDVVVVGAGPAGSATAWHLAHEGCDVVLVERTDFDAPRPGESLLPSVQPLLRQLGAWEAFLALSPQPSLGTRSLWGDEIPQGHSHLASPWSTGWHVDRAQFDQMLAQHARSAGATLITQASPLEVAPTPTGWRLTLSNGDEVHARALVDATGRGAGIARKLGAERILLDRLVAVGATLPVPEASGHVLVEAVPDGWWYTAPAGRGQLVTLWMTDADLLDDAGPIAAQRSITQAPHTRARIGEAALGGLTTQPAFSQRTTRSGDLRAWLTVGDAALGVDPISGSGVRRGLAGAVEASRALIATLDGDPTAIGAYETAQDDACTTYLLERAAVYGQERRWPTAPFWRRRLAVADQLEASAAPPTE